MNKLSEALKNRHYPKTMILSIQEAYKVLDHFHTSMLKPESDYYDLNKFSGYFTAYYNTKKGVQKSCFIIMEKE